MATVNAKPEDEIEPVELKKQKKVRFIPGNVSSIWEFKTNEPMAQYARLEEKPTIAFAQNSAIGDSEDIKALVAPQNPQQGVQQRTLVGKTVATLAPVAALGALIAYE